MRSRWFRQDGTALEPMEDRSIADFFEEGSQSYRTRKGMPVMPPDEKEAFLSMIRSMLVFRPEDRPTAEEVLKSEWMVKWGLPALERDPMVPC